MTHPILAATSVIDEALKTVADTNPAFMATADKASALRELVTLESRVVELRMRILADADDLAAKSGARDAAGWLADSTRTRFEDARADLRLGVAVDRRWQTLGAALRDGRVNTAQASVIVRALDAARRGFDERAGPCRGGADRARSPLRPEAAHADRASHPHRGRSGPRRRGGGQAARRPRGRGSSPDAVVAAPHGDGTTRLSGLIPDAAATRLATYLEAYANPRRDMVDADPTIYRFRGCPTRAASARPSAS